MEQTPLEQALQLGEGEAGQYPVSFAPSVCFGNVVSGGLIIAAAQRAAVDMLSRNQESKSRSDLLHVTTRFFRPTFAQPQTARLSLRVVNATKAMTTIQIDLHQKENLCVTGFLTMTSLLAPGHASAETGWMLSPPTVPSSIPQMESGNEPNWIGYLTPFAPTSYRNPQSYVKYHIPARRTDRHTIDQWISPGWQDPNAPNGPVWTNETIHFVVDNCFPHLNDIMAPDSKLGLYDAVLAAGRLQHEARARGQDDKIWGEGLRPQDGFPWIISSISINTEVKKKLSPDGERWLFMRATAKSLHDGRMDIEIILMDSKSNLVALSNQILQVIPLAGKMEKRPQKAKI